MSERSVTIQDENGKFQLISIGCSSQSDVLGLIEAARIYARCIFIGDINESQRASGAEKPESKEVVSCQVQS